MSIFDYTRDNTPQEYEGNLIRIMYNDVDQRTHYTGPGVKCTEKIN